MKLKLRLHRRAKSKYITVAVDTPNGERLLNTGCTDMAEAKQVIKDSGLATAAVLAKTGMLTREMVKKLTYHGKITTAQAVEEWEKWLKSTCRSDRTYQTMTSLVKAWVTESRTKDKLIADVDTDKVSKWINPDGPLKANARRVRLAAVRSLFRFAQIRNMLPYDVTRAVSVNMRQLTHEQKEPEKRLPFTPEEFKLLETHLERELDHYTKAYQSPRNQVKLAKYQFWYAATMLGRYSGLRLGDICTLEWDSFKEPGVMIVWTDKRDTRVALHIDDDLARAIACIPTNRNRHCFPDQNEIARSTSRRALMSVQFARILKDAKVEGKTFHSLRYSRAQELNARGTTIEAIAEALGHGSTATTSIYLGKP
jgi:integrase